MTVAATYVDFNEWIVTQMGDAHTLAHVHAGLAIYVVVQIITRDRRASIHGLISVFGAAIANEILEAVHYGAMRWSDTISDIGMTAFWPIVLVWVGLYRRPRWERQASRRARHHSHGDASLSTATGTRAAGYP